MKKILIVDDDFEIREILYTYLIENKFTVETAENLKIAEQKVHTFIPDLILLDMHLPDGDGIDFLKLLKQQNIKSHVIMVTGETDKNIALNALDLGASDYITKPINLQYLNTSILAKLLTSF